VILLALFSFMFIGFPAPLFSAITAVRLAQVASCAVWLLVLIRQRPQPRVGVSLAAFGFAPLPQLVAYSVVAAARVAAGPTFQPLLRQSEWVLIIAVLAPPQAWVAMLLIVAFAIEACLEHWIAALGASKSFGPYEPWLTLGAAALAIWIAYSRARLFSRERTLARQLREATEAARMAKLALAVLDLGNTPLQVIELQLTLLEERQQPVPSETMPIRRALTRLNELNRILATYLPHGDWPESKESIESFDAAALLRHSRPKP
jgi:hypothetical protein